MSTREISKLCGERNRFEKQIKVIRYVVGNMEYLNGLLSSNFKKLAGEKIEANKIGIRKIDEKLEKMQCKLF